MPYEEKLTWVGLVVEILVYGIYGAVVFAQLGSLPAASIAYQKPMLLAVGASIVLTIVGSILMSIGSAISAEIRARGSGSDIDRKDERDTSISKRGDLVAYYVSSVGVLGALALTMLRAEHFWIANAILLTFVIASLVSGLVKLAAYRRGF